MAAPSWLEKRRSRNWLAEAVGFEFLIRTLCDLVCQPHKQHIKIFGDNRGVVEGWWKGRSRNKPTNEVFRRIHQLEKTRKITFHSRYVASRLNPADDPSRGIYPPCSLLLPPIPVPHELQLFLVDYDAELLPGQHTDQNGSFHQPLPKPPRTHSDDEYHHINANREQQEELAYLTESC